MTLHKIPRDTVVGTVGDYVNIEREESVHPDERLANMYFEITTFGDPVVIEVEYTWHPEETEDPEIKTGMVVRIGGWLAEPGPELNPELGYGDKDGMEMETWEVEGDREVSVLVCGGRNFNGWTAMQRALDRISPDIIIHGAAGGPTQWPADTPRRTTSHVETFQRSGEGTANQQDTGATSRCWTKENPT